MYATAHHYMSILTHEVLKAEPNNTGWTHWVYEVYPRLQTEKWRFSDSFFLSKANQLLFRFTLVIHSIIVLLIYKTALSKKITNTYHRLTELNLQRKFIPYITILLYTCLLLVVYNAILEFKALALFSPFYKPTGIAKLLLPVFPSDIALWLIYSALIGSIISVVAFPKKWIASSIAAIAFIYYQLILFGFGKYDHGFSTLTYALLIYPFFLWEADQSSADRVPAWSIVLIQWMICLSYFYCGLEKLFISGPAWFYSDNLQQHLLIHETELGVKLASYAILCKLLSFGVLVLQLSFILLPFRKKLAYLILPAGIIFHTAAWLLLEAGGLFNPWWGVYLFFLFPLQPQETK
jgi:hypothetical protein